MTKRNVQGRRGAYMAAGLTLLAAVGCARGATSPSPAPFFRPSLSRAQPSARQVHNDATYVRGPGQRWVPTGLNESPGAITVGETTRQDLVRLFGYPTHRHVTTDGGEVWYYASGLRPPPHLENPFTTRSQRIAAQRKVAVTFAKDSAVVTHMRTYVTGERAAEPFRDTAPPLPELEPDIVYAPPERSDTGRSESHPLHPTFPSDGTN